MQQQVRKVTFSRNPVASRDLYFSYGGMRRAWFMSGCVIMPAISIGVFAIAVACGANLDDAGMMGFSTSAVIGASVFGLSSVIRGARTISIEKESHTMELLLVAPLLDKHIIRGKLIAVIMSNLPWLAMASISALIAAILSYDSTAILIAIASTLYLFTTVLAVTCAAMFLSLWFNTPLILGICFPLFLIWNSMIKGQLMIYSGMLAFLVTSLLKEVGLNLPGATAAILPVTIAVIFDVGIGVFMLFLLRMFIRGRILK